MSERNDRNRIQNIVGIIVVLIGVILSFVLFYDANVKRITHQNETYIADIANQRAAFINGLFDENLAYIESAAIVTEKEFATEGVDTDKLNVEDESKIDQETAEKVGGLLRNYEERFVFDHLRFIDIYGRDYTTGEKVIAANVSDRPYFKEAIRGKTGITYILDSKVTSERQIGFYSPVYQDGNIAGFVIGFYGEAFIDSLIDVSVFEQRCRVILSDRDGTIIYSTTDRGAKNFINDLKKFSFPDEEEMQKVRDAYAKGGNTLFDYEVDGDPTVGCVSYVGNASDYFLVLVFPADAYKSMIRNSNMNGAVLLLCLMAIFLVAAAFYIARFFLQKKHLLEETKNSNDIHFAMSRLFENFVLVNTETHTYHYIEGMHDVGHIPNDGPYEIFADDLLSRFPVEKEKKEAAELISFDHLTEMMNSGANIVSYNLHAPIREEEWFTYNFIVVSRDDDGKVKEFIIARQDITKLQEKEEETRRVLERARDEAEKGNRAKSDFLSSMSHDIRTPMNAIIGYTNIAKDNLGDQELVSNSLNKIQSSSQYLLSLINDVLDMSRIESGKIMLNEKGCDLRQVFDRIADMTRSQANKKNLEITYDIDGIKHPNIVADELRLEQVLVNITGNAVKYTPDGGSIAISAVENGENSDGSYSYTFTVKDTGIGMSEEFLPHLFESFSRETTSTINKIQGTGLGMAITARLVELMGGKISVSSKLGEGSEFKVSLDLMPWDESVDQAEKPAEESHAAENIAGKKVLLVEDNDINAEIATLVLTGFGVELERACNGAEGFEKVKSSGDGYYDAVLMDIQMPEMNGYEATRAIRGLGTEYTKRLPIIAMSANAYDEDIRASLDSGMNGHIAKPFDPEDLAAKLDSLINGRQLQ